MTTPSNIFLFAPNGGAFDLADSLGATRLRRFDGMDFWRKGKRIAIPDGGIVINWGGDLPPFDPYRILNGTEKGLDYQTIFTTLVNYASTLPFHFRPVNISQYPDYIGRTGDRPFDPINPPKNPTFYTKRVGLVKEWRIHVFNNRIIKSGTKIPRLPLIIRAEDWAPGCGYAHPWWRTDSTGWHVDYTQKAPLEAKPAARKALTALGLTFAAIDVALDINGHYRVTSVKTAPALTGTLVDVYSRAIERWIANPVKPKTTEPGEDDIAAPAIAGSALDESTVYFGGAPIAAPPLVVERTTSPSGRITVNVRPRSPRLDEAAAWRVAPPVPEPVVARPGPDRYVARMDWEEAERRIFGEMPVRTPTPAPTPPPDEDRMAWTPLTLEE